MPPDCSVLDIACQAQDAATSAFTGIATAAGQAAGELLGAAMTWWLQTPSVDPDSPTIHNLQQYTMPIALAVLVGSIFNQSIRMVVSRRKDPAINVGLGLIRYAVITAIGLGLLALTLRAGDDFSAWLVSTSIGTFAERMAGMLTTQAITNPFLLLCMGLLFLLLAAIQWVLGLIRQGGILVLAVLLPLAASGSINDSTKAWFNRMMPWLLALALYKPTAALIYAIGFTMIGQGQDLNTVMTGLMVLVLATVALPAMMKFFSWSQATTTSGSGSGGVLAGAATGAMSIAALQSARGISISGPGSGPSGATSAPEQGPGQGSPGPQPTGSGSSGGLGGAAGGGPGGGAGGGAGDGRGTPGAAGPPGAGAGGSPTGPQGAGGGSGGDPTGGGQGVASGAAGQPGAAASPGGTGTAGATAAGAAGAAATPVGAAVAAQALSAAGGAVDGASDTFTAGEQP